MKHPGLNRAYKYLKWVLKFNGDAEYPRIHTEFIFYMVLDIILINKKVTNTTHPFDSIIILIKDPHYE